MRDEIAEALRATLMTPDVLDSNLEPANVVDGLFFIGRAVYRLAEVLERYLESHGRAGTPVHSQEDS
ncbi:hypothetical protein Adeg_0414 [Ammonifex degensii KC4]|uniref:Uncharacterized protein n=1 Tax=Ammonifex degensii (strain DSM 10501 / KC4) TaxID=429009 RepID=C9RBE0_AMMDK|nr:hypothetical protein [Ammonifex degensii]ACX51567.1 hypothetical protein Adeg_0414 [Ammonifex degensii KC4]